MESILAFLAAFEKVEPEELLPLFPKGIPFHTFEERSNFARTFFELRASLAEAGLHLQSAARLLSDHGEAERWSLLAGIEKFYLDTLRRTGRRDREAARLAMSTKPKISADIREVVVVGIPDLSLLAASALGSLSDATTLSVLIPTPDELAEGFDSWGRPILKAWSERSPGWDDFDAQVHLCARGEDIAAAVTSILPVDEKPDSAFLELGALDRGLLPWLRSSVEKAGGSLHDPEGESLDRHWLARLLNDWAVFLDHSSFSNACEFLRNGAVAAWLKRRISRFDLTETLAEADRIRANYFPSTAASSLRWSKSDGSLQRALKHLLGFSDDLRGANWIEPLRSFVDEIAETAGNFLPESDLTALNETVAAIHEALDQIHLLVSSYPDHAPARLASGREYLSLGATPLSGGGA